MALAIYKPGQGYWTRVMTAIGAGTLVLTGVGWLWARFPAWISDSQNIILYQTIMAVAIVAVFGGVLFYLLNKPRIVDFMIATEAEMKKVNWPSRREVIGSTWIVICGTFLLAAWLYIFNLVFAWLFFQIGVLES